MGFYDVIDDISRKQITKTAMGDNRIYGVVVATVVNNYDEKMPGRVCISVINRNGKVSEDNPGDLLKWARVAMPSSGAEWGHYFLPEVGDQVLVVFEDGNIEKPYIIGCIPKVKDKFFKGSVTEKNVTKTIQTKYGNKMVFTDAEYDENSGEEPGQNDKIEIITAKDAHKFILDNEKSKMTLTDKEGKNVIDISTKSDESGDMGQIIIKTVKKLQIQVGDNVKVTMSSTDSGGSILVETGKITLKTSDSFKVESSGRVDISGSGAKLESTAALDLKGQSTVSVSGGSISIG